VGGGQKKGGLNTKSGRKTGTATETWKPTEKMGGYMGGEEARLGLLSKPFGKGKRKFTRLPRPNNTGFPLKSSRNSSSGLGESARQSVLLRVWRERSFL